jgi:hypothetical protein
VAQLLLVDDLRSESAPPGALVSTQGAGEAVAVDKELDRAAASSVELTEFILEQRETETAGKIERQVRAVPRLPTTTRPG